jgi:hypothetical protein
VCADHYGNLITDLEADCLRRFAHPVIWFRNRSIPLQQSYGFAPAGELLGLVNSWGTLEIALAQGMPSRFCWPTRRSRSGKSRPCFPAISRLTYSVYVGEEILIPRQPLKTARHRI